ncbi:MULTISPECIES: L-rhamnose mutarotase [Streptomyces]|uniref:L-rhamnose mutarotase n=1 Tax=Streptomyces edwardsiae TaxID=3075527 RepID=A0ABU2QAE1_9ACTN|nr:MULTISPECIES: L-rhamnose mutarotase [unclassified Streptomyces]MDT0401413.1 L-rhamnose mutarotase [Streptomyces sp. DSM 41635]
MPERRTPRRVASVIRLRPEHADSYRELHRAVPQPVLDTLSRAHITNYSIFLRDDTLFAYYEYTGDDYDADMAAVAADPGTRHWWTLTDPCQQPLDSAGSGERWVDGEELFHLD